MKINEIWILNIYTSLHKGKYYARQNIKLLDYLAKRITQKYIQLKLKRVIYFHNNRKFLHYKTLVFFIQFVQLHLLKENGSLLVHYI